MSEHLTEIEVRVLGSLVEKQLTTPEYYPLTINALTAACNQKTNREPVVSYDEKSVTDAVESLREKNLAYVYYGSTSRVAKYKHRLPEYLELEPSEVAVMCVLMLRGAQTLGELRDRTNRLYDFKDLNDVNETLESLLKREDEPLIVKLERQPGQKEPRFAHLLAGEVIVPIYEGNFVPSAPRNDRLAKLEQEVEDLRTQLNEFQQQFEQFKKQFE